MKTRKTPTDLELLNYIYNYYYESYAKWEKEEDKERQSKIYVPIDCQLIAKHFDIDRDVVFGRLYYHLEKKYGYKQDDGSNVHFFAFKVGNENKCIHFPYLASVLADLRMEHKRFKWTVFLSSMAIILSAISIGITVYKEIVIHQEEAYRTIITDTKSIKNSIKN
ncbi:TPA: hypothetical protein ACX6MG_001027 [Photobacterium damselae]|uniref:hypothetical protein n=1 Tax=Photobacterium damselae TaxID=38293 RepID=UPI001F385FB0|nr:hypothetical protein [Photobacterium damselae]UKA09648.1 hypothetical protein IHC91_11580 [Photobacterium damselae subsp. damselae]